MTLEFLTHLLVLITGFWCQSCTVYIITYVYTQYITITIYSIVIDCPINYDSQLLLTAEITPSFACMYNNNIMYIMVKLRLIPYSYRSALMDPCNICWQRKTCRFLSPAMSCPYATTIRVESRYSNIFSLNVKCNFFLFKTESIFSDFRFILCRVFFCGKLLIIKSLIIW